MIGPPGVTTGRTSAAIVLFYTLDYHIGFNLNPVLAKFILAHLQLYSPFPALRSIF